MGLFKNLSGLFSENLRNPPKLKYKGHVITVTIECRQPESLRITSQPARSSAARTYLGHAVGRAVAAPLPSAPREHAVALQGSGPRVVVSGDGSLAVCPRGAF